MGAPEFRMEFPDLGAMQREIATNIRFGRVFLSEVVEAPVLSDGVLVLIHPDGRELRLPAQVVMVNPDGPMRGTGIALRAFGPQDVGMVEAFAAEMQALVANENGREITTEVPVLRGEGENAHDHAHDHEDIGEADTAVHELAAELAALRANMRAKESPPDVDAVIALGETLRPERPAPGDQIGREDVITALGESVDDDVADPWSEDSEREPLSTAGDEPAAVGGEELASDEVAFDEDPDFDPSPPASAQQAQTRQDRLRSLSPVQQVKLARKCELADRVLLERLYGKQVWEGLLSNPRITLPEVARIARKGSVPRPLLEQIWENGNWIKDAAVRRALLSNPKTSADAILKLLRLMPRHELKLLEKGTAYSMAVRDAARKLLRD